MTDKYYFICKGCEQKQTYPPVEPKCACGYEFPPTLPAIPEEPEDGLTILELFACVFGFIVIIYVLNLLFYLLAHLITK